jgi:long-chain acyl-CoA synthetase
VRAPASDEQRERAQALVGEIFRLEPGARTVIPAPLYHTAPNVYALSTAVRGLDMTIMTSFDAHEFLRIVAEQRVSVVQMVPTMFVRLLALAQDVRTRYDVSSLRWIVHAAAPCPIEVKRAMIEWLGPIVAEYYGGTETGPVTFCTSEEWLAHPGTVGRPLDKAVIKIFDAEGRELPVGESGEVYMWLDLWPDFTYAGDEAKRRSVEREGLVSCGDIGYLDADGYLFIVDRLKDMIVSGGENVYSVEVESVLAQYPAVAACAVIGVPDETWGERVHAVVVPVAGATVTLDELRAFCRERIAGYKTPRSMALADALPLNAAGKVLKRDLRRPYWQHEERAVH